MLVRYENRLHRSFPPSTLEQDVGSMVLFRPLQHLGLENNSSDAEDAFECDRCALLEFVISSISITCGKWQPQLSATPVSKNIQKNTYHFFISLSL